MENAGRKAYHFWRSGVCLDLFQSRQFRAGPFLYQAYVHGRDRFGEGTGCKGDLGLKRYGDLSNWGWDPDGVFDG